MEEDGRLFPSIYFEYFSPKHKILDTSIYKYVYICTFILTTLPTSHFIGTVMNVSVRKESVVCKYSSFSWLSCNTFVDISSYFVTFKEIKWYNLQLFCINKLLHNLICIWIINWHYKGEICVKRGIHINLFKMEKNSK